MHSKILAYTRSYSTLEHTHLRIVEIILAYSQHIAAASHRRIYEQQKLYWLVAINSITIKCYDIYEQQKLYWLVATLLCYQQVLASTNSRNYIGLQPAMCQSCLSSDLRIVEIILACSPMCHACLSSDLRIVEIILACSRRLTI